MERFAVVLAARVVLLRPMVDDQYLMCSAYAASQQGASGSVDFVFIQEKRLETSWWFMVKFIIVIMVILTGTALLVTLSGELKSFLC